MRLKTIYEIHLDPVKEQNMVQEMQNKKDWSCISESTTEITFVKIESSIVTTLEEQG